jgi:hypothetical protein
MRYFFFGLVVASLAYVNYLAWQPWVSEQKKRKQETERNKRMWEEQLLEMKCDLAMAQFNQIADDENIHEDVKDALFLVEVGVKPVREEQL